MNDMKRGQHSIVTAQSREVSEVGIDPVALLLALWRRKLLIGFVTLVFLLTGGYYAYVAAVPMYQSTAVVMLNNREEQIVDLSSVVGGLGSDSTAINTEIEVLKSRSLLGKVVDHLDLTNDPEFNLALIPPSRIDIVKAQVRRVILPQPSGAMNQMEDDRDREGAINQLLAKMNIQNVPSSVVFRITVETINRRKSALIANTIVDTYILNQLEVKFTATEQATSWLAERVSQLQQSLEGAEAKATDFRSTTTLISPEALTGMETQVKDLRDRIDNAETAITVARSELDSMEAATTPEEKFAASNNDPQLRRLLAQISDVGIAQIFDTRFSQLSLRARNDLEQQQTQLGLLKNSLIEREKQIARQSEDLIVLQQLTREAEASRLLYEYFLTRLKETSAQEGIQQADSRMISPAVVPVQPSAPRKPLILAMAGMLGLLLSSVYVLLHEMGDRAFRSSQELEAATGYPVVGQIPLLPVKGRKQTIEYFKTKPTSAEAEAIRNLRTSVMLFDVDNPPKVIMTCSSLPGEGKTTIALALSQNYAEMGKKVLMIEGDMRRRVFSDYVTAQSKYGLLSVLSGVCTLEDAIAHDDLTGTDILFGEKGPSNAADVFASDHFTQLINKLRDMYDLIIIDTPPVLIVPDARLIAQNTDIILFVVKWDATHPEQVAAAQREFQQANSPVSGLVLNQISPKGMKRYGYSYKNYAAYGGQYYDA